MTYQQVSVQQLVWQTAAAACLQWEVCHITVAHSEGRQQKNCTVVSIARSAMLLLQTPNNIGQVKHTMQSNSSRTHPPVTVVGVMI